nr:MAG TPA: hypothetical protein [Podoviridae sp. ctY3D12]
MDYGKTMGLYFLEICRRTSSYSSQSIWIDL